MVEGDEIMLIVRDDGVGMPSDPRLGRGLAGMRQRAADLGGRFEISPRDLGGTEVRFSFPIRGEHE